MRRLIFALCLALLLCGCSSGTEQMDRALALRTKVLAQGISFDAVVTADYGSKTFTFTLHCQADAQGNLNFTVLEPKGLAGITGTLSAKGGKLTFDKEALAFDLLADGQLSPVAAPWVLLNTLRSGYLTACCTEDSFLRVSIDDSYAEDSLHLDVWLGEGDVPVRSEILYDGRRILTVQVENFTFV